MVYVSFVEIFIKSLAAYEAVYGERLAPLLTMFTFFGGVAMMALLDALVHWLDPNHAHDVPAGAVARDNEPHTWFSTFDFIAQCVARLCCVVCCVGGDRCSCSLTPKTPVWTRRTTSFRTQWTRSSTSGGRVAAAVAAAVR